MRRFMSAALSLLIAGTLAACSNTGTSSGYGGTTNQGISSSMPNNSKVNTSTANNMGTQQGMVNSNYKNGTYTGYGNKTSYGNQCATVTLSGGRITSISLATVDKNGKNMNDNTINKSAGIIKNDLVTAMLQSQTYNVSTTTSGGDNIAQNWKLAVQRALTEAKK